VLKREAVVTPVVFASHRIKRVCASSLSVEALAVSEAVQMGDFVRALLAEILLDGFRPERWETFVEKIRLAWVTDCKSVYDNLLFDRGLPRDKRLAIEIAGLREALRRPGNSIHWVPGRRLIVDGLTKSLPHPDLLLEVMSSGRYALVDTPEELGYRAALREKERGRRVAQRVPSNLDKGQEKLGSVGLEPVGVPSGAGVS
jgi:hypothetical protein